MDESISKLPAPVIDTVGHDLTKSSQRATCCREHNLTIRQAISKHKNAVLWATWFIIPTFRKDFGYEYPLGSGDYVLAASWTAAYPYAPIIGFILGPLWVGWCSDRFGPRKTLLRSTTLSLFTLLIQILGNSAAVIFVGAIIIGLLTGAFPALGPAYISEILPIRLRGIGLAANNFAQNTLFPIIFIFGAFFAPEIPWFLVKKKRYDNAIDALKSTGYTEDIDETLAHMKETILLEEEREQSVSYLDCFKGANFRRAMICTVSYSGQFFSGVNVASSYATYYFQMAGMLNNQAFRISLGLFALGIVGNILTCGIAMVLMFLVGFLDLAPSSNKAALYAKSTMLLIFYFVYNCGLGPLVYAIMAEVPSTSIRGKTLGVAASAAHIFSLVITAGLPYNKTFEELDLLFEHKVPAWKFDSTDLIGLDGTNVIHGEQP
ncbi:general substrate transporter [Trichoderma pleuroticola]